MDKEKNIFGENYNISSDEWLELVADIRQIKNCLLGSDYDDGLVKKVNKHEERLDKLEIQNSKVWAVWGGVVAVFTVAITTFLNWVLIFKKH